ncbi:hypothetical protein [Micromonospora wenchangensis]
MFVHSNTDPSVATGDPSTTTGAAASDGPGVEGVADDGGRVAVDEQQVGAQAGGDAAAVVEAEPAGRGAGGRTQSLGRGEPGALVEGCEAGLSGTYAVPRRRLVGKPRRAISTATWKASSSSV